MKIVIKSTNIKLTPALRIYIHDKINSLEKFSKILKKEYSNHFFGKGKPKVEAWVEIEKTTRHHYKGPFFRAECQMRFPGQSLRAETKSENLRLAISEVKDMLQRQLKRYKNKRDAQIKKGARKFKKSLKLSSASRFTKR